MFSEIEINGLEKSIFEDRIANWRSSRIVLAALIDKHEFGKGFFHKSLSRSILKPGSLQAK